MAVFPNLFPDDDEVDLNPRLQDTPLRPLPDGVLSVTHYAPGDEPPPLQGGDTMRVAGDKVTTGPAGQSWKPDPTVNASRPQDLGVGRDYVAGIQGSQPSEAVANESGGPAGAIVKALMGAGVRPEVAQMVAQRKGGADDELAAAQRKASMLSGLADVSEGLTGMMGAGLGSRQKPDSDFYARMRQQSSQPVDNLLQRRAAARQQKQDADADALSDPNSPESQRARNFAKGIFAETAKSNPQALAAFDTMSAAEIAHAVPVVQKLMDSDANRDEKGREFDLRQKELAQRRREDSNRHEEAMDLKREVFNAQMDQKRSQQTDRDVQNLEKRIGSDASDFATNIGDAEDVLSRYKDGSVPGVGPVRGHVPDFAVSPDGRKLRQALGQALAAYRHEVTGSGMSNQERQELNSISGLAQTGTDAQIRQAVDRLKHLQQARLTRTYAGFSPEAVQTYTQRNPSLAVQQQQSGPTGESAPLPAGARTFYSAKRDQTKIIYPDGHEEVVNGRR